MEYAIIAFTVLIAAGLTFFSGFGLGTIMLPVFSIFFDLPVAIGATAIVHLANNIFKFFLVRKDIDKSVYLKFGIPAMLFAAVGGWLLTHFSGFETIKEYSIGEYQFEITYMNVVIGSLMIFFAWFELMPKFKNLTVDSKYLPIGGILSGFFGGLSGHQGAFRSAFLSKSGLNKEQFIGTSNAISLTIDFTRIPIYLGLISIGSGKSFDLFEALSQGKSLLLIGILFAFLGTYIGKKLVGKTTIVGVQRMVGVLLFVMGALLVSGIIH
ncbi:MAG: putative membrane protein YfcA [Flavobacteriaceae bacterium]|jgi:uncharacterized membrane protein YfcA